MKHFALFAGLICLGLGLVVLTKSILSWQRNRLRFEKNVVVTAALLLGYMTPATVFSYFFFNDETVLRSPLWRGLGFAYELLRPVLLALIAFFVIRLFLLLRRESWRRSRLFAFWGIESAVTIYRVLAAASLISGLKARRQFHLDLSLSLCLLVFYGSVAIAAWRSQRARVPRLSPLQTRYLKRFSRTILAVFCVSATVDAGGFFGYPKGPAGGLLTNLPVFLFLAAGLFLKSFLDVMYPAADAGRPWEERFQSLIEEYGISPRERDVVLLVCRGKTNKEIEQALFISLPTVKDHISNIFRKTGVANRVQLAALFHFRGNR